MLMKHRGMKPPRGKNVPAGRRCDSCAGDGAGPAFGDKKVCRACFENLRRQRHLFSLTMNTLGGDPFKVHLCKKDDLIGTVKKRVIQMQIPDGSDVAECDCELVLNGSVLEDGKSLQKSGVDKDSCLNIIWKDAPDSDSSDSYFSLDEEKP